ncbi:MAG: glucose-6-phosphate isomerase [Flavobacterium sp.]
MALKSINPTTTGSWQELKKHFASMQNVVMQDMFAEDATRAEKFQLGWNEFLFDYSKNKINSETIDLLLKLAEEIELKDAISKYFEGDCINETENRAVLHTTLRTKNTDPVFVDGKNILPEIEEAKKLISTFTNDIVLGNRTGFTGKKITDVVNIGIGGSDLGPAMVVEALQFYKNHITTHFVSNVDGDHVQSVLQKLNPETTLFIIVSKTFVSQETLTNSETIKKWFLQSATQNDICKHFVAVTTNSEKAIQFGIDKTNIFPMWDWVGGRFSLWSPVGLSISLSIGFDNFEKLLKGAYEMDEHFRTSDFDKNIPVILALLSVWYNNFFGSESEALIPYAQSLQKLAPYLQQGIMESNGKSTDRNGNPVNYQTGTIIWGEPGTNSQHAFFQLIHQGTKLIPVDFIGFVEPLNGDIEHHDILMANFFAQTEALLKGKTSEKVMNEFKEKSFADDKAEKLLPFKIFPGNKPTNTILIQKLTPENLGALIAMYEHKIFVQGVIWNIFSYDQWGVELGKELASTILSEIKSENPANHDSSTNSLLKYFLEKRK